MLMLALLLSVVPFDALAEDFQLKIGERNVGTQSFGDPPMCGLRVDARRAGDRGDHLDRGRVFALPNQPLRQRHDLVEHLGAAHLETQRASLIR